MQQKIFRWPQHLQESIVTRCSLFTLLLFFKKDANCRCYEQIKTVFGKCLPWPPPYSSIRSHQILHSGAMQNVLKLLYLSKESSHVTFGFRLIEPNWQQADLIFATTGKKWKVETFFLASQPRRLLLNFRKQCIFWQVIKCEIKVVQTFSNTLGLLLARECAILELMELSWVMQQEAETYFQFFPKAINSYFQNTTKYLGYRKQQPSMCILVAGRT